MITLTDFACKGIFAPNFSLLIGKYFVLIDQSGYKIYYSVMRQIALSSKGCLCLQHIILTQTGIPEEISIPCSKPCPYYVHINGKRKVLPGSFNALSLPWIEP